MMVNDMMAEGLITSYAVSADGRKCGVLWRQNSVDEATRIIDPVSSQPFMEAEVKELLFHHMHGSIMGTISPELILCYLRSYEWPLLTNLLILAGSSFLPQTCIIQA